MKRTPNTLLVAAAALAGLASTVSAQFILVDDFNRADSSTLGNGWTVSGSNVSIDDGTLLVSGNDTYAYKGLGTEAIANDTTGTFFFQVYIGGTFDESLAFGLSDLASPQNTAGALETKLIGPRTFRNTTRPQCTPFSKNFTPAHMGWTPPA